MTISTTPDAHASIRVERAIAFLAAARETRATHDERDALVHVTGYACEGFVLEATL